MTTLGPTHQPQEGSRGLFLTREQATGSSQLFSQLRIPRKALELYSMLTYPLIFLLNKELPILRGQKLTGIRAGASEILCARLRQHGAGRRGGRAQWTGLQESILRVWGKKPTRPGLISVRHGSLPRTPGWSHSTGYGGGVANTPVMFEPSIKLRARVHSVRLRLWPIPGA